MPNPLFDLNNKKTTIMCYGGLYSLEYCSSTKYMFGIASSGSEPCPEIFLPEINSAYTASLSDAVLLFQVGSGNLYHN